MRKEICGEDLGENLHGFQLRVLGECLYFLERLLNKDSKGNCVSNHLCLEYQVTNHRIQLYPKAFWVLLIAGAVCRICLGSTTSQQQKLVMMTAKCIFDFEFLWIFFHIFYFLHDFFLHHV